MYRNLHPKQVTRRWFFEQCGVGLGSIALGHLLAQNGYAAPSGRSLLAPKQPHFAPKAKRVIFLFMAGAPSHLELFDNKPELAKFDGTLPPAELLKGYRAAFINPNSKLLGPKFKFAKHGQMRRGAVRAAAAPGGSRRRHRHRQVDGHRRVQPRPGQIMMNTGSQQFGRPSIGAWVTLRPGQRIAGPARLRRLQLRQQRARAAAIATGAAAFCRPSIRACRSAAAATRCCILSNPRGVDNELQRDSLDAVKQLNQMHLDEVGDPEIATRINSFEMAYRMQASAPELMDISQGAEADARDVRRRAGQAVVRQQLPAGPAAGRARRAVRAALPRSVGPARQPGQRTSRRTATTPTRPAPRWSRI